MISLLLWFLYIREGQEERRRGEKRREREGRGREEREERESTYLCYQLRIVKL